MISPWEIAAFLIMLPIVWIGVWFVNLFDTDGPPIVEFEAWCRRERPLLFAIRCEPDKALALRDAMRARLGARAQAEHHRGRFPWTRYVFRITIDVEGAGVLRGRIERATVRGVRQRLPELGAVLDESLRSAGARGSAWVHTELHDGDEARGIERRGRGWTATLEDGALSEFTIAPQVPRWVQEGEQLRMPPEQG